MALKYSRSLNTGALAVVALEALVRDAALALTTQGQVEGKVVVAGT